MPLSARFECEGIRIYLLSRAVLFRKRQVCPVEIYIKLHNVYARALTLSACMYLSVCVHISLIRNREYT